MSIQQRLPDRLFQPANLAGYRRHRTVEVMRGRGETAGGRDPFEYAQSVEIQRIEIHDVEIHGFEMSEVASGAIKICDAFDCSNDQTLPDCIHRSGAMPDLPDSTP